jgi:hypothetical protein
MFCRDCKFWDSDGSCGRVDQWRSPVVFEIEDTVDDDSGLTTLLKTGPDFGCVLFQPSFEPTPQPKGL